VDHSDTVAEACVRHPWPNDPGPVVEGASSGRAAPDADPSTPTDSGARTSRDADAGRPAHRDADGGAGDAGYDTADAARHQAAR
jgi:hypothetical protein